MNNQTVIRDERTSFIENASYRVSYQVIAYGLLAIVAYRGFFLHQSNWDLLALAIISSLVGTLYQGAKKALPNRWIITAIVIFIVAGLMAGALVYLFSR